jgi:hypothetical protein
VAGVIGAVGFDAGEFLVDETREYGTWTDRLGVPRHVFSAVFRAVIARGQDYRETFQVVQDSTWIRPTNSGPMRASLSGSGRKTYIPMCSPRRPASGMMACGSAWPGIRRHRAGGIPRGLALPADMIA